MAIVVILGELKVSTAELADISPAASVDDLFFQGYEEWFSDAVVETAAVAPTEKRIPLSVQRSRKV